MTMAAPDRPERYSERLPVTPTVVVDRDSGEGVSTAVEQAVRYGDYTAEDARRLIVQTVRTARAGDVVTIAGVRVALR